MTHVKIGLLAAALALVAACDKPADTTPLTATTTAATPTTNAGTIAPAAAGAAVEVSADGTKFDPPIKAEQLPEGAFYCDMGTVHYAQMTPGEKCPTCGMKLKVHKVEHVAEPSGHDHGDGTNGHGHDHAEGDHHH